MDRQEVSLLASGVCRGWTMAGGDPVFHNETMSLVKYSPAACDQAGTATTVRS